MNKIRLIATAAALIAAASSVHAVSVTVLPGSTVYLIPVTNAQGAGPETIAPGITWSSGSAKSLFGWTGKYDFISNGRWEGQSMFGSNDSYATMRVDFATAVAGVGAFLNYAPGYGSRATIAIYDSSDTPLESYMLTFSTSTGEFHGFLQGSSNIAYMTFSGEYIGAANLEVLALYRNPRPTH